MTDSPNRYESMIARLSADPAFATLAKANPGILVWDVLAERILWASNVAAGLRNALADAAGRVDPSLKARERLKALASGLAPSQGMRLERLWLDPDRLAPPITCACRMATSEGGEPVLVTAIIGAPPKGLEAPREAEVAPPPVAPVREVAPAPVRRQEKIRFVWQADAETRFIHVSPELAEVVGPMAGDVLGQTWGEVSRSVVEDPEGVIASLLARHETWSGRSIFWAADNGTSQIPVDWAGMPVFGADKTLIGFRGFGVLHPGAARERQGAPVRSEPEAVPPVPEPQAVEAEIEEPPPSEPEEDNWFAILQQQVAASLTDNAIPETTSGARASGTSVVPPAPNRPQPEASGLSNAERNAFREIARSLGARIGEERAPEPAAPPPAPVAEAPQAPAPEAAQPEEAPAPRPPLVDPVLDRLPSGILVHRDDELLFANRALLEIAGFADADELVAAGGFSRLFKGGAAQLQAKEEGAPLSLSNRHNESIAVDVRVTPVEWQGKPANLLLVRRIAEPDAPQRLRAAEMDLQVKDARVRELESILDTATDGVIALDETGRILSMNRSAEALFGYDQREVVGDAITVLLAPESHIVALDYLEGLRTSGVASLLNDGREVLGRVRQGGTIPLFMTMGHIHDGPNRKFCAVLRDITAFKKAEGELVAAKRNAEEGSAQKSDLLAKISHEIRTPLNAIIGFAEVMLEERFGSIGNERYKDYLKDVHASGAHVISLVNDLLDLAKIEAGRMDLSFTSVNLNDLVSSCCAMFQPQAARDRIVIRTSFAPKLPAVVADERSLRQIVLNLVSNAIKFTDAGGQVILSTALTDRGEVAFRVRDTGIGMTDAEIEAALEPFRQIATAHSRGGTGLGLPLTKALVEANRGALQISSNPNEGTLVEVIFPPTRVLAE
ncbi:PAS domain-containing sensor histidine kinase [Microvirga flavescens]|uniref:PAS domain-containing sensor histidine kinase n=1 Tax=Microvirga flavescens TaxID=2249811 RepID=UPI000DD9BB20|nr:ATP-binding protein [Microvirga flavescens]